MQTSAEINPVQIESLDDFQNLMGTFAQRHICDKIFTKIQLVFPDISAKLWIKRVGLCCVEETLKTSRIWIERQMTSKISQVLPYPLRVKFSGRSNQ